MSESTGVPDTTSGWSSNQGCEDNSADNVVIVVSALVSVCVVVSVGVCTLWRLTKARGVALAMKRLAAAYYACVSVSTISLAVGMILFIGCHQMLANALIGLAHVLLGFGILFMILLFRWRLINSFMGTAFAFSNPVDYAIFASIFLCFILGSAYLVLGFLLRDSTPLRLAGFICLFFAGLLSAATLVAIAGLFCYKLLSIVRKLNPRMRRRISRYKSFATVTADSGGSTHPSRNQTVTAISVDHSTSNGSVQAKGRLSPGPSPRSGDLRTVPGKEEDDMVRADFPDTSSALAFERKHAEDDEMYLKRKGSNLSAGDLTPEPPTAWRMASSSPSASVSTSVASKDTSVVVSSKSKGSSKQSKTRKTDKLDENQLDFVETIARYSVLVGWSVLCFVTTAVMVILQGLLFGSLHISLNFMALQMCVDSLALSMQFAQNRRLYHCLCQTCHYRVLEVCAGAVDADDVPKETKQQRVLSTSTVEL